MGFFFESYQNGPGPGVAAETFYDGKLRWGKDAQGVIGPAVIDGSTRDSSNSTTTQLRQGLLLGQIASSGNLRDYGDSNTDGSDVVAGILLESVRITDINGSNVKKFWGVLLGGPVQAANIYGLTEQARAQMQGRFLFDDRAAVPSFYGWRRTIAKTGNYTVVNGTDNGTVFTTTANAGAITFTLPTTIKKGQRWLFFNTVDQNMTVTAAAGKLVTFNNVAATSVAFSTAGNKIGACVEIMVDDTGAKYIAMPAGANTMTVA